MAYELPGVARPAELISGQVVDINPPPKPGAIEPPVHETFGVQRFGAGVPTYPLAPDIGRSMAEMFYPVRPGTFLDMAMVMEHPVQAEMSSTGPGGPGFLPDLFFYQHPSGLDVQFPSAQLPTHYPLEGVTYNNVQVSEDDYLELAKRRVMAALGGG